MTPLLAAYFTPLFTYVLFPYGSLQVAAVWAVKHPVARMAALLPIFPMWRVIMIGMQPNAFGGGSLWCSDWYGVYPKNAVTDPVGPQVGSPRVLRGGGWENNFAGCRSAVRYKYLPASRIHLNGYGFRVALSSSGIPKSSEADK